MANIAAAFLELVAADKNSEDARREPRQSDLAPEAEEDDSAAHARMRSDSWNVKQRG
jgi:hypothetical protein